MIDVQVRAELPQDQYTHLYRLAEEHGTTVASLVRELVRRHLTGECQQPKQLNDGRPLADEAVARILALHSTGLSDAAIAKELGISGQTARRYRRDAGLEPNAQNHRLPEATVERIRALHGQGLSDRAIGVELGISNKRVGNYRNRLDLPKNSKGGRPKKHLLPA